MRLGRRGMARPGQRSGNANEAGLINGRATYAPIGALALDDVEVEPVELWPERPLLPEVRVDQHGDSCVCRSAVSGRAATRIDSPAEIMPETSPTLITLYTDV